jgi:DNA polymerase-3 subunit gamma/tau
VPVEAVAEHLLHVAKDEGMSLTPEAAHVMARQTEGSVRDALSLLDQASVLGAGTIDETVVASLIGSGRSDARYAIADAISVGDTKGVFEVVDRLVQEGQDLRHVTSGLLAHFRDLLLMKTAPGQHDLLDATDEEAERLSTQAAKFSEAELARVLSLLVAAQADMRWTTSPRLSLELALVRATVPETDAQPHALVSRLERLERIAGITAGPTALGAGAGSPGGAGAGAPGGPPPLAAAPASAAPAGGGTAGGSESPLRPGPGSRSRARSPKTTEAASTDEIAPVVITEEPAPSAPSVASAPVLGAGTSAVDVAMIRANWATVIQHLRGAGKAVLPSFLEIATPAAFDGSTLELVFPPDRRFGVTKVEEREDELRATLQELFGVAPAIKCVVREPVAGVVDAVDEDPPLSEEEALARLTTELGATPTTEDGA